MQACLQLSTYFLEAEDSKPTGIRRHTGTASDTALLANVILLVGLLRQH
jgi:hypothetical protein